MTHLNSSPGRRAATALALTPAVLLLTGATPAFAAAPQQWEQSPSVSPLHFLLIVLGIPAALFVIISLLVYVPSLARGERYKPGLAWRNEPEWFGGPSAGLEAADRQDPAAVEAGSDERGGARAQW
ncbi:MAG: aa3-type cytochrome oxidase subunit CtaJ [Nocardioides sp.]